MTYADDPYCRRAAPASPTWGVHLVVPSRAAERDLEAHWKAPPMVLKRPLTDRHEVLGETQDLQAAARWVLSYGAEAEVKGPPALREEVRRQAVRIACRHTITSNGTLPNDAFPDEPEQPDS